MQLDKFIIYYLLFLTILFHNHVSSLYIIYYIEWRCNVCLSYIPCSSNNSTGNKPGVGLHCRNGYRVGNCSGSYPPSLRNSGKKMQHFQRFFLKRAFALNGSDTSRNLKEKKTLTDTADNLRPIENVYQQGEFSWVKLTEGKIIPSNSLLLINNVWTKTNKKYLANTCRENFPCNPLLFFIH